MDNETYLIKRGWRISESGLTWVDPQDQWAPARVFLAVQIQTERDAEQLDIVTARVAELEGVAQAGYQLSTWAASICWTEGDNTAEWLEGLKVRIEATQAAYDAVLGDESNATTK